MLLAGAFAVGFGEYDQDDREADKVWDDIDEHMDLRRRKTREQRLKKELEETRKRNPKITETFADLKRDIAEKMSADDWEVVPVTRLFTSSFTQVEAHCPLDLKPNSEGPALPPWQTVMLYEAVV